jgi:hypothetical protein
MSATEMANKFFGDFVPGCFIHEGFVEKRSLLHRFPQSAHGEDEIEQDVMGIRHRSNSSSWTTWDTMHLSG